MLFDFINSSFYLDTGLHKQYGPDKTSIINATGGGAYKYANVVREKLGITFKQGDEMSNLVKGLNFLLLNVEKEAFWYNWREQQRSFLSPKEEKVR
jgi:type II pantothenate kinase